MNQQMMMSYNSSINLNFNSTHLTNHPNCSLIKRD